MDSKVYDDIITRSAKNTWNLESHLDDSEQEKVNELKDKYEASIDLLQSVQEGVEGVNRNLTDVKDHQNEQLATIKEDLNTLKEAIGQARDVQSVDTIAKLITELKQELENNNSNEGELSDSKYAKFNVRFEKLGDDIERLNHNVKKLFTYLYIRDRLNKKAKLRGKSLPDGGMLIKVEHNLPTKPEHDEEEMEGNEEVDLNEGKSSL